MASEDEQRSPDRMFFVGCAGWSVPKTWAERFPAPGTHLERYAARFSCVEINSSFYRPHRPQTYSKWAALVPDSFRFAVKVPKSITHEHRLKNAGELLDVFLKEVAGLSDQLGPFLVQLPPSLAFDQAVSETFFSALRERFAGQVVCEPRHASWFEPQAGDLLAGMRVARVAADPAIVPQAALPGGWSGLNYFRLHGSPTIYRSAYSAQFVEELAAKMQEQSVPTWCIFDNTAEGAATGNALQLGEQLRSI